MVQFSPIAAQSRARAEVDGHAGVAGIFGNAVLGRVGLNQRQGDYGTFGRAPRVTTGADPAPPRFAMVRSDPIAAPARPKAEAVATQVGPASSEMRW